jgi:biphenyl 2,3-dioxygenase beta subunit
MTELLHAATHSAVNAETQHEIQQFLFFEARLLDEWRWRDWYNLFTEDSTYFMPVRKDLLRVRKFGEEIQPGIQLAHFDEDKRTLGLRIAQKETGKHWSEDPPSRSRHYITNVWVSSEAEVDGVLTYEVESYFFCYRNRLQDEVDQWAGMRKDVLRRQGPQGFEIAKRDILIDQNLILSKNLSMLF